MNPWIHLNTTLRLTHTYLAITPTVASLLQDQIEFLQEQLKPKDKIINCLIEFFPEMAMCFFRKRQQH